MVEGSASRGRGAEAVLGKGLRVVGRVRGDGDLQVEAEVEGDISVAGQLHLDEGGTVTGTLEVDSAVIAGVLVGDVKAEQSVTVTATGRVTGDVAAAELSLESGASFDGQIHADFEMPEM